MKLLSSLFAMVAVGGLLTAVQAGEKTARPIDRDFLLKVATCNNAEIQIGKLANKRSDSTQVKDFATQLMKDHKAAGEKLAELLKGRKLAIAAGFDKETKDEVKRLSKMEGTNFDRAFLQSMVKSHKDAIGIFENQVKNGQEADIRAFAKDLLPHLRHHLSKAQELSKAIPK